MLAKVVCSLQCFHQLTLSLLSHLVQLSYMLAHHQRFKLGTFPRSSPDRLRRYPLLFRPAQRRPWRPLPSSLYMNPYRPAHADHLLRMATLPHRTNPPISFRRMLRPRAHPRVSLRRRPRLLHLSFLPPAPSVPRFSCVLRCCLKCSEQNSSIFTRGRVWDASWSGSTTIEKKWVEGAWASKAIAVECLGSVLKEETLVTGARLKGPRIGQMND